MNCSDFNQLLDLYIDGELDDSRRAELEAHAAQCCECRDALAAAEQLRDILSHMDDDISVPLKAQAAWRKAVKAEAQKKRMKRIYSLCGAIAAVCVLSLGVTTMLRSGVPGEVMPKVARIEADGISDDAEMTGEIAMMAVESRQAPSYIQRTVRTEDPAAAGEYLSDVIAEYGAVIEREAEDADGRRVFVQVPGENVEDFIAAVDGIGLEADAQDFEADASAVSVGVCILIQKA